MTDLVQRIEEGRQKAIALNSGTCGSCGAEVIWIKMRQTGKRAPLNAEPDPEKGNVIIGTDGLGAIPPSKLPVGGGKTVNTLEDFRKDGRYPLYLSHFATCPQAGQHRKR